MVVGGTGKAGKPLSSVVKGEPMFLCFISAVKVEEAPAQIVSGVALIRSCRKVAGEMLPVLLRKSFAPGPLFEPHQLSSAVKVPAPRNKVRPLTGVGTVLPTRREKVTLAALPPAQIAPPEFAA